MLEQVFEPLVQPLPKPSTVPHIERQQQCV